MRKLIGLLLIAAGCLPAQKVVETKIGNATVQDDGSNLKILGRNLQTSIYACVGAPGNTVGPYLSLCAASSGALYACANAAGCTVSGDWAQAGGSTISGLTTGTIPKATSATTIGDGPISDDGTNVSITGRNLAIGATLLVGAYTIAAGGHQLPAAASGNNNYIATVTDGATATDCTTGSGSIQVLCISNGTIWKSLGGGSGGGGLCPSVNAQSGTSYTLALADGTTGGLACIGTVTVANASNNTVTVPLNSSVAFPIPDEIDVIQLGAGQTCFTAAGGVTLTTPTSLCARAQNSTIAIRKIATNTWIVFGDTQ